MQECEASGAASLGNTNGIESRAAANEGQTSAPVKGDASASAHFTSDSGSRKTAFALAMRSGGVNSTPESRDSCTGGGKAGEAALGSNMTSSVCQKLGPPAFAVPLVTVPADLPGMAPRPAPPPPASSDAAAPR